MSPDELQKILSQREGLKLDFKREYKLNDMPPVGANEQQWNVFVKGQWDEFIKDILALANGNIGTAEQAGVLVIGADDKLLPDGTRQLHDASYLQLTPQQILAKVNSACDPPIPDIQCEHVLLDAKNIFVITIPPTPYVHETTRQLEKTKAAEDETTGRFIKSLPDKTYTARTAFVRRNEDIFPATDDERQALKADKSPETVVVSSATLVLDEFAVPKSERERIQSIFSRPRGYNHADDILRQGHMLWVTGPSGVGKRTLSLALAMEQPDRPIYSIPRFANWSQLDDAGVSQATIILPDALGAVRFEREKLESEFADLEKVLMKENLIIITSPDDVFADAARETRLIERIAKATSSHPFSLDAESYDYKSKVQVFRKMTNYAHDVTGIISDDQQKWALELLESVEGSEGQSVGANKARNRGLFQRLMQESWLPIDIERFVLVSLPSARRSNDVFDLLRRDADIDSRVHSWFVALDDSSRCFMLTLALFAGLGSEELWDKHKEIVTTLRKLDPTLSIFPLGILRQRTTPYVTEDGQVDFINPRVYKAVVNELAKNYREYFIELIPLFRKWSIPDLPRSMTKEERDERIAQTADIRNSIARMVGEVGKYGVEDITEILTAWATHSLGGIGITAGIALRQTAMDPASAQYALNLLHDWSADFTSEYARFLRWASASAMWRIASIKSRFDLSDFALRHLQRLAKDSDDYVVSSAAHAFRMIGRTVPIESMSPTLTRLAKESEVFTRQQVALAVDESARQNRESAYNLLDVWASMQQTNVHWTAIYTLLIGHNISRVERYPRLAKLMQIDAVEFADALQAALGDEANKDMAWSVLETLSGPPPDGKRVQLVSTLADVLQTQPSIIQDLHSKLSVAPNPNVSNLLSEMDTEVQARIERERAFSLPMPTPTAQFPVYPEEEEIPIEETRPARTRQEQSPRSLWVGAITCGIIVMCALLAFAWFFWELRIIK